MGGILALIAAVLAFAIPMAIPLLARRWRAYAVVLALAVPFFIWLNADITAQAGGGAIGAFLGGLMLTGFSAGAIARFVMLLGRPREEAPTQSHPPDPPCA